MTSEARGGSWDVRRNQSDTPGDHVSQNPAYCIDDGALGLVLQPIYDIIESGRIIHIGLLCLAVPCVRLHHFPRGNHIEFPSLHSDSTFSNPSSVRAKKIGECLSNFIVHPAIAFIFDWIMR